MAVIVAADKPSRSLTTARNASRTGEVAHRWSGAVTTHETPALREELYRLLGLPGCTAVRLHVDSVTEIDHFGVALLIGANHNRSVWGTPDPCRQGRSRHRGSRAGARAAAVPGHSGDRLADAWTPDATCTGSSQSQRSGQVALDHRADRERELSPPRRLPRPVSA